MSIGTNRTLIIGAGEIGKSLYNVLKDTYEVSIRDRKEEQEYEADILHICYPYSGVFEEITKAYIEKYNPKVVVIHSTVPVGTTRMLGENVLHSPVRGKHPQLEESIKHFTKEIGGSVKWGYLIRDYFRKAGIPAEYLNKSSDDTEFAKIMSTSYYGFNIVFCKEMKRLCDEKGIDFEYVYKKWNIEYNNGYETLGDRKYVRPVLDPMPGKIGGHCIINNCKLEDNVITKFILEREETYD